MKEPSTASSRYYIAATILRWLAIYDFPDRMLEAATKDRAFIVEVVLGIIRNKLLLEHILGPFVKKSPTPPVLSFLLTGAYQLLLMDNVEDYAAVNETVEAAKSTLRPKEVSFLNAVLRRLAQNRQQIKASIEDMPAYIRFSHPNELYRRWVKNFGEQKALDICEWNNSRAFMWVKPYMMEKEEIEKWLQQLKEKHKIAIKPEEAKNGFFQLPHGIRAKELAGFAEGKIVIADPAIWYAIEALDPKAGDIILDACASPGGKTALIAEQMHCEGTLVAMDINQERVETLKENITRLKLGKFIKIIHGNAANITQQEVGYRFNKILVDAPCSNTGVIRRKPDIRWRFDEQNLEKLVASQSLILTNASHLLSVGGTIVYSTCSIEPEENELLVNKWLTHHKNFKLISKKQIIPSLKTQTDGAFVAVLVKSAED